MKNTIRNLAASMLLCAFCVSGFFAPLHAETSRDVTGYDKVVQNTINTHCTDCHDNETQKGKVRLDNFMSLQEADKRSMLDRITEQVYMGLMPPKKKNLIPLDERKALFAAIQKRQEVAKTPSGFNAQLQDWMKKPGYGNYVDHDQLFSGVNKDLKGFTYDREWLISEFIFAEKINALLGRSTDMTIDGQKHQMRGTRLDLRITNPFLMPRKPGVRYFAPDKLNSSHFLTMMGNAKFVANAMINHLSRSNPDYLPAVSAMTRLKFEHDAILDRRRAYLDNWLDALCGEIYGSQNASLLPAYTKIELDGEISEDLNPWGKNRWRGKIGPYSPYLMPAFRRFAKKGVDKLQIIRESERFWFHWGYEKDMVARLMNILRENLASVIEFKAKDIAMPKRPTLDSAELAEIQSTIKALRTKGMTYMQMINVCMDKWETDFQKIREKSDELSDGLTAKVIAELYQKLFERQPTPDESQKQQALLRLYAGHMGIDSAVARLTETMILTSEFICRNEYGVGEPDEYGRRMLSPRDASYAIAYALTDNTPDETLKKAAAEGRLNTRADYKREVERLLKDTSHYYIIDNDLNDLDGVNSFTNMPIRKLRFFREYFGYYNAMDVFKDQSRLGARIDEARERLITEADMLVEHILTKDKDVFETLLTTDKFYVFHSGDNDKALRTAKVARKAYDYFKGTNWKQFRGIEDVLPHKEFLLNNHLPGFRSEVLKNMDADDITKRRAKEEAEAKAKAKEAEQKDNSKGGRRGRAPKEKKKPDAGDMAFITFINALCDLEEQFEEGKNEYIPVDMQLRSGERNKHHLKGISVATFYNIDPERWDYPPVQPAKIEHRMGMLTHPAWLQAFSKNDHTDAVLRGKWIREKLLAQIVPEVPIGVDAVVPDDHTRTLRVRLEEVTMKAECSKCHQYMNPMGNALEMYDDFGRFRTEEELEHPDNKVGVQEISHHKKELAKIHPARQRLGRPGHYVTPRTLYKTLPVDTSGELVGTGDEALDGKVKDGFEMIERLAKAPRTRQAIIRHAFRYFLGRNEMLSDSKTLLDAEQAYLQSGGSFDAVIVSLLTSDSFIYRKEPKE